jgi:hypothetical protein
MRTKILMLLLVAAGFMFMSISGCDEITQKSTPVSSSGVEKMTVEVRTNDKGHTVEQEQVGNRLANDNKFGAIKHLYVISPYSGQVILYSTVKGKVTSSGKRLTPTTVASADGNSGGYSNRGGIPVNINGETYYTSEVLQDDGTYGTSDPYIYWFDSRGIYHQHYMTGGQIIHVSDQPLSGVKSVVINMEER